MSDYVSAFDWEMNFISPEEHLDDIDWTATLEGPIDDSYGLVWNQDPVPAQPNKG